MSALRLVVIGAGHLGRIHAKLAASSDQFELIAVVDPSPEARQIVESLLGVQTVANIDDLRQPIDAAVVASPTVAHYEVASRLLRRGIHCLIEKPLATTADQADRLVQIAKSHHCVLQVGHVERFNPCWTTAQTYLGAPKYVEAIRAGAYSGRSTDIGVVMDLMIHDIDLLLSMDRSPVQAVHASGIALLGNHEDLAEARIEFASGCIATLRASRVASQPTRHMQIFATTGHASIDFSSSEVQLTRPSDDVLLRAIALDELPAAERMVAKERIASDLLRTSTIKAPQRNAILDEQNDFAISIKTGCSPAVSGEDGARAVRVAGEILAKISQHQWDGKESRPWRIGALATPEPRILPLPTRPVELPAADRRRAG